MAERPTENDDLLGTLKKICNNLADQAENPSSAGGGNARVRAATTANITIATALNAGDSLDGVTLVAGDLVLVKDQSTPAQNGIYEVGPTPARADGFDEWDGLPGVLVTVQEGTVNADTLWLCTADAGGTLDTTSITFGFRADPGSNARTVRELTTSGNVTLTSTDKAIQVLTPDANRDCSLPSTSNRSGVFTIAVIGGTAFTITLKNSGGTTLASLPDATTATCIWLPTAAAWIVL